MTTSTVTTSVTTTDTRMTLPLRLRPLAEENLVGAVRSVSLLGVLRRKSDLAECRDGCV